MVWFFAVCILNLLSGAVVGAQTSADTVRVTILHSNDSYGQLRPRGSRGSLGGGMAAQAALIRAVREAGPALVLDAGDAIGPNLLSASDQGRTMTAAMRMAGYHAMTPGNHEFDFGVDELAARQAEAGFPFLAANLKGTGEVNAPVQAQLLTEVGGVPIGVLGLISPAIQTQINPKHIAGLVFEDPLKVAPLRVKALREAGAAFVIAVVHMNEGEALALARQVAGIDLVIAGGYSGLSQAEDVMALVRLQNGVRLVTTSRYNQTLGKVEVVFARGTDGRFQVAHVMATDLPIPAGAPTDAEVAALIETLTAAYRKAAEKALGQLTGETLEAQGGLVANMMRWHAAVEVGILNRGSIRRVPAGQQLTLGDVYRLVYYDDDLVKMTLSGKQLRSIAQRSQQMGDQASGLIFAGLDPKAMTVNGRLISNNEPYQVATSEFLANGGDGYALFAQGTAVSHTGISLRGMMSEALKVWGTLSPDAFESLNRRGVWRSDWSLEGAFNRNYIDGTTEAYRVRKERVSFLSGETTIAWNATSGYAVGYETGRQAISLESSAKFGQIGRTFGDLEKSADALDVDLTFRYKGLRLLADPFAASGISTAFTKSEGRRPWLVRSSLGFQRRVGTLVLTVAGRGQRDFVADENDYGLEVSLNWKHGLKSGGQVQSRVRSFAGVTGRQVRSVENYNVLSFPLAGALSLVVRQNNFIYRVDTIQNVPVDGVAFRTDLTVGLAYGRDWKWF